MTAVKPAIWENPGCFKESSAIRRDKAVQHNKGDLPFGRPHSLRVPSRERSSRPGDSPGDRGPSQAPNEHQQLLKSAERLAAIQNAGKPVTFQLFFKVEHMSPLKYQCDTCSRNRAASLLQPRFILLCSQELVALAPGLPSGWWGRKGERWRRW